MSCCSPSLPTLGMNDFCSPPYVTSTMCQDEDGPRSNEVFVTDYTLLCSYKGVICGGLDKNGDPIAECQGFRGYVRSLPIPHKKKCAYN